VHRALSFALAMRVSIPNDHTKVDSAYVTQVTSRQPFR
jgi:hypothetical protein